MPDLRRPSSRTALAILATLVVAGCGGAAPPASGPPSTASSAAPVARPDADRRVGDRAGLGPGRGFRMGTDAADIRALMAAVPPDWVAVALPSEKPAHDVTLTKGYWIDTTEVTNTAFQAFMDAGGYTTEALLVAGRLGLAGRPGSRRACRSPARATPRTSRAGASPGSRRRPMRPGAAADSRPRPNGSTRRAARIRRSTRGATTGSTQRRTSSTAPGRAGRHASRRAHPGSVPRTWPATRWSG